MKWQQSLPLGCAASTEQRQAWAEIERLQDIVDEVRTEAAECRSEAADNKLKVLELQAIAKAADAWLDGFRQANETVMFSEEVFAVREGIHDDAWDQWGQDAAEATSKEK